MAVAETPNLQSRGIVTHRLRQLHASVAQMATATPL